MGIFSKVEGRIEDTFEGAANIVFDSPLSPVQIAKKAEKKMRREKIVGAGKQYAPTLYTVLVNASDDQKLFGYYPTLAGETETYLAAKAAEEGLTMDGQPLVRFIADDSLKRGKFDVIAELVASPIIAQLRAEEMDRYGIGSGQLRRGQTGFPGTPGGARSSHPFEQPAPQPAQTPGRPPLPYVPEDEIDYSIDYGEYTFDSQDFDSYQQNSAALAEGNYSGQNSEQDFEQHRRRISEPLANPAAAALGGAAAFAGGAALGGVSTLNDAGVIPVGGAIQVPNTVVFTPGSGNAQPTPNVAAVKASLLNATDNRTYDLATSRLLMGRENKNDIVVDDINASRTHAELRFEPQGVWVITDLGSTNGTLVNGQVVTSQALRDGDYITIGMTNFVFIQV